MVKHDLYIKNNIKFVENINMSEDLLVIIKLAYYAKIIINEPSALYYYDATNEKSITRSYSADKAAMELKAIDLLDNFLGNKMDVKNLLQEKRLAMWLYLIYDACLHGNKQKYNKYKNKIKELGCTHTRFRNKLYHFFIQNNNYQINRFWSLILFMAKKYKAYKNKL